MKSVPLGSQNTVEFTASLPFSQHSLDSFMVRPDCELKTVFREMIVI